MNHGGDPCISFGGLRLDRAISTEVIVRLQPLGIDAALAAMDASLYAGAKALTILECRAAPVRFAPRCSLAAPLRNTPAPARS
jgi:hypothetical protein